MVSISDKNSPQSMSDSLNSIALDYAGISNGLSSTMLPQKTKPALFSPEILNPVYLKFPLAI